MQSETPLEGDEEEKAPLLAEGGFFRFSGVLNTEKAASVSLLAGRGLVSVLMAKRCVVCWQGCYAHAILVLWASQMFFSCLFV